MPANLSLAKAFVELSLKGGDAVIAGITEIKNRMTATLAPLADAFRPAQQAVLGFVGAASPQAFDTFQGSVKLLSSVIGQTFIPYIIKASQWIQDLAQWIRQLDPDTKKQISTWATYALELGGVAAAALALNSVWRLLAANPLSLALSGIVLLLMKINDYFDQNIKKAREAYEAYERMGKGIYTEKEYKGSAAEAIESDKELSNAEKLAQAELVRANLQEKMAQFKKAANDSTISQNVGSNILGGMGLNNRTEDMEYTNKMDLKQAGMLDDLINRLKGNKGGPTPVGEDAIGGKKLMLGSTGMGGQTSSLESAFTQTASAALGSSELAQKQLEEQMETNALFRENAADTKRIADGIDRMQMH